MRVDTMLLPCIKSVQRVHGTAGSRRAPLAVHDLLFVERRKRLPRKVCPRRNIHIIVSVRLARTGENAQNAKSIRRTACLG